MMISHVDVFCSWTYLGDIRNLGCATVIFKDSAVDLGLRIVDRKAPVGQFVNTPLDWEYLSYGLTEAHILRLGRAHGD